MTCTANDGPAAECPYRGGGWKVKPLEWKDADQGMCTKWSAKALGGQYELVAFSGEEGFAVNFYWGRPLAFWFIQGEPDDWGPTGPKMFPTLEAAKAAAQADYEARILACLEPAAPTVADDWNAAIRAAATICNRNYGKGIGEVHAAILALLRPEDHPADAGKPIAAPTVAEAAKVLLATDDLFDALCLCDGEAAEIANRISGKRGERPHCPDGVQVLEDAETIMRAALRALAGEVRT